MKSLLVANSVATAVPEGGLSGLTKGQIICVDSNGAVVTGATEFKESDMVQFVVGLGNGKTKCSAWINPLTVKTNTKAYVAPGKYVYAFTAIALPTTLKLGDELVVTITVQDPKCPQTYHHNVFDAIHVVSRDSESSTDALKALKADVDKVVAKINEMYGDKSITATPDAGTTITNALTLTGKEGLFFSAKLEGVLTGTLNVTAPDDLFGQGVGADVVELEKEYAVYGDGYNPSVYHPEDWYGDIFNADATKKYKFYIAESKSPQAHAFGMDSEGMIVKSLIAFDTTGTSTTLDEIFTALSAFSECEGDEPAAAAAAAASVAAASVEEGE